MNKVASLRPWQRRMRVAEIRDMAVAQLFYKRDGFDQDTCRDELNALVEAAPREARPTFWRQMSL